jgi:uncharacterized HhH-GPD family protein
MPPGAEDRLFYTDDDEANRLVATDPMALLIGFSLDQQVPVQKAFFGPLDLKRRVGTLDPRRLAEMDSEQLATVFRQRPALHRYPAAMAERVQALARHVVERYGGDAGRIWGEAADGRDLKARLAALPGFGEMKVAGMLAVLGKRLGVQPPGWEEVAPGYPTLGDVDSPEALADYQAKKRAYKATLRASGERFDPRGRPTSPAEG